MKKIKVLLSALAMVAAMAFVSCGGGAGDDPTGGKSGSDAVVFDGNVDLTVLDGYDATAGGIVKDFGSETSGYATVASFKLSDLGYTEDSGFTKVAVIADVYNDAGKIDIASTWSSRIMITVGDTSNDDNKNFNAGVADQTQAVSSADDELLIQIKGDPVRKVVITAITFSK